MQKLNQVETPIPLKQISVFKVEYRKKTQEQFSRIRGNHRKKYQQKSDDGLKGSIK